MIRSLALCFLASLLLSNIHAVAQDEPATQAPTTDQPAVAPAAQPDPAEEPPVEQPAKKEGVGPATQQWQKVFGEWKNLLLKLRQSRDDFRNAGSAKEAAKIRKEYHELLSQGRELLTDIRRTASAAYAEAPNEDRELRRFLLEMAADEIGADQYEKADVILRALVANNCPGKHVHNMAGIAAFCLNDFKRAQDEFLMAGKVPALQGEGKKFNTLVSKYTKFFDVADIHIKLWEEESKVRESEAKANLPRVKFTTTKGDIVIELFENEAEQTVGNFIHLVEDGFYDGLKFHRVLSAFMAQGGCPNGDGRGGPGYFIPCETEKPNHRKHFRGSLSMAHAGKNTGGSQFFLTFVPASHLNGKHTVFGRVIQGIEVASSLNRTEDPKAGISPDKIIKAEVLRKTAGKKYEPTKVSQ